MSVQEDYSKWHSPSLRRDFEMLVFGHGGLPLILFPTSKGSFYQNRDQGMIDAANWFVENGKIKIYCPDSIDSESWYNKSVSPAIRAYNQNCYARLIHDEILQRALQETGYAKAVTAGCSFGGYHAVNTAFRHPDLIGYCLSMSGAFDISHFADGYYDDNIYFNNPVDYIPGNNNPEIWKMGIILGTASFDICLEENKRLSGILHSKNINHWLDIRQNATHDWPVWREMFPAYLEQTVP